MEKLRYKTLVPTYKLLQYYEHVAVQWESYGI